MNLLEDPLSWNAYPGGPVPAASWNGTSWEVGGPGISTELILQQLVTANEPDVDVVAGTFYIDDEGFDAENPKKLIYESGGGATFPVFITSNPFTYEFSFPAFEIEDPLVPRLIVGYDSEGVYPASFYGSASITPAGVVPPEDISYNCSCDDTTDNRTLLDMRTDMMGRLGYGAQANNPPPGMVALLNSFLKGAQESLYRRYDVLRTERWFSWPLVAGVRMYDLPDNIEECTKKLDPRKLSWVGVERDETWYKLICGIPPELYTFDQSSWPTRYEIRQCIEVWPVPSVDAGTLRIKGRFGLEPFSEDTDRTTIDSEMVFLLALANAKAHYRQPDANNYVAQLETMMMNLVAGSHHTRRYVPGAREYPCVDPVPVWTTGEWPGP